MKLHLHVGDCRAVMATLDADSVDAIVTDPPYEIGFMNKGWDRSGVAYDVATWTAAYRVVKPGGHLLAFGGTRTAHRMVCAIEDAGFEIRDTICWLYGSGFPKSLDIGKAFDKAAGAEREAVAKNPNARPLSGRSGGIMGEARGAVFNTELTAPATDLARQWDGWGTALKPGYEPIIVARKPFKGTVAANVEQYGTGAINIDACRTIGGCRVDSRDTLVRPAVRRTDNAVFGAGLGVGVQVEPGGRWPANLALDEAAAAMLDEQSGASRFFYVAKASTAERHRGVETNDHPTVKPISLMQWPIRLVTPPGGVLLDCFVGSGSTAVSADRENVGTFHGIDVDARCIDLTRNRFVGDAPLFNANAPD